MLDFNFYKLKQKENIKNLKFFNKTIFRFEIEI